MEKADIKNLLTELEKLREKLGGVKYPGPEITSGSNFDYYFRAAKDNLWECIKCVKAKLTGDIWWGTEYQKGKKPPNVDLSDDYVPIRDDKRDEWPHAIPMPGGAWQIRNN